MKRLVFGLGALAFALTVVSSASAQTPAQRETARHLMDEGDKYFEQKRFDLALRAYQSGHAIMHVPSTGIEVARAYEALGKLIEAREAALAVTRMPGAESEPKPFAEARRDATQLADKLQTRIPTLRFELPPEIDPAGVKVSIDYEEVALTEGKQVNPGRHTVRAKAEGYSAFAKDVDVKPGAETVVKLDLSDRYVNLPLFGKTPPLAVVGLGVAATGVLVGTITGIASLGKASAASDICGADTKACPPNAADDIDAARTLGWTSTISFAIAIVGGGIATYSILSDKKERDGKGPQVDVVMLPAGAGLRGTF